MEQGQLAIVGLTRPLLFLEGKCFLLPALGFLSKHYPTTVGTLSGRNKHTCVFRRGSYLY